MSGDRDGLLARIERETRTKSMLQRELQEVHERVSHCEQTDAIVQRELDQSQQMCRFVVHVPILLCI